MTNVRVMETQGTWSFFSCLWLYRIITHKVLSLVLKHPFPITFFWHPCTGLDVGEIFVCERLLSSLLVAHKLVRRQIARWRHCEVTENCRRGLMQDSAVAALLREQWLLF